MKIIKKDINNTKTIFIEKMAKECNMSEDEAEERLIKISNSNQPFASHSSTELYTVLKLIKLATNQEGKRYAEVIYVDFRLSIIGADKIIFGGIVIRC